jgi:caffeoyl-CoA O-methyltransferase
MQFEVRGNLKVGNRLIFVFHARCRIKAMKAKRPAKPPAKYTRLNDRSYAYVCACRSHARDPVLDALRATTEALGEIARMQIGREQGAFMTQLVRAIGAREAIEIGTFTGYSSICIARGLGANGRLLCLDMSEEWTNIARKFWKRAGVAGKIELQLGPAMESLRELPRARKFQFAFIDADKPGYDAYYEAVLPRMQRNGLILFDNMMWGGRLEGQRHIKDENGRAIDKLNRKLAKDKRVESVLLPLADGIHICRVV